MKSLNALSGTADLKVADRTSRHRTARRLFWSLAGTLVLVALLPVAPAAAATPKIVSTSSTYHALTPSRIMDTRSSTKLGPGGTRDLVVAGVSGVPGGATAVVLNVTVTGTTTGSILIVYPTGTTRPLASNLNWTAGKTIANLVEVPVGTAGKVTFYNAKGSTHVIADLEGYFAAPSGTFGQHVALTPARIADTRTGSGQPMAGQHFGAGQTRDVQVAGVGGVPPDTSFLSGTPAPVSGVILNVTATNTTTNGFFTVWPAGATRPTASNVNWVAGQTIPNRVFVPLGAAFSAGAGKISVYNAKGTADVVVDVSGYFTDSTASGANFTPQNPIRIKDTRTSSPIGAGGTLTLQVGGVAGVPTNAKAVILNVTATNTTASSAMTVYPATVARPTASDLNWTAGVTIPNLTVATLGSNGAIKFYNPRGSVDVVVDLFGYFGPVSPTITAVTGPCVGTTICTTSNTSNTWTGTAAATAPGATITSCASGVQASLDGAPFSCTGVTITSGNGTASVAWSYTQSGLSNGTHTVQFRVIDSLGGTSATLTYFPIENGHSVNLISAVTDPSGFGNVFGSPGIILTFDGPVSCPDSGSAAWNFTNAYIGPGATVGGSAPEAWDSASGFSTLGPNQCDLDYLFSGGVSSNDFGTIAYTPPLPADQVTGNPGPALAAIASHSVTENTLPQFATLASTTAVVTITVTYDEPILCSTLAAGGTDFTVTVNAIADAVVSAACVSPTGGSSDTVNIVLLVAPVTGTTVRVTSSGNTVSDQASNFQTIGQQISHVT